MQVGAQTLQRAKSSDAGRKFSHERVFRGLLGPQRPSPSPPRQARKGPTFSFTLAISAHYNCSVIVKDLTRQKWRTRRLITNRSTVCFP